MDKLRELNAPNLRGTQQFDLSLRTSDQREAEARYRALKEKWDGIFEAWERLLETGPQRVLQRHQDGLIGEAVRAFLAENEGDPRNTPKPKPLGFESNAAPLPTLSEKEEAAFKEYLALFLADDSDDSISIVLTDAAAGNKHADLLLRRIAPQLYKQLEIRTGPHLNPLIQTQGIVPDHESQAEMLLWATHFIGQARQALAKAVSERDWQEVDRLKAKFPQLEASPTTARRQANMGGRILTFAQIIDEEERLTRSRLEGHQKSTETFRKYRAVCGQFAAFRDSDNALTVTLKEAERWRDSILAQVSQGDSKRRTARGKTAVPRAVIGWAIEHNQQAIARDGGAPLFPNGNPLTSMRLPAVERRSVSENEFTEEQARRILGAARGHSSPEYRWLPWIMAYTGLRISDARQLRRADFKEHRGTPYIEIAYEMGATLEEDRTQKTKSSWYIPIHRDLESEGLLLWVAGLSDGPLFKSRRLEGNYRAWIHSLFPEGLGGRAPAHAWRHTFESCLLGAGVPDRQANYIMGRGVSGSAGDYGQGLKALAGLKMAIDQVPPFL